MTLEGTAVPLGAPMLLKCEPQVALQNSAFVLGEAPGIGFG